MENTNQNQAETCSQEFSQRQQHALATWARSLSDHRLEVTRNQLLHAIVRRNADKDDTTTGFALIARLEAVTAENERRGVVPAMIPLCIPWGKSLNTVADWSLTDFTKVPPTNDPPQTQTVNPQAVTAVHFPTLAHVVTDDDNPDASPTVIHHPTVTHFITHDSAPNSPQLVSAALYTAIQNLNDATIQEINAVAAASRLDNDVEVPDLINDAAEAENYRLADNDTSGLPIISCETIDVDNDFWDIVYPANIPSSNDNSSTVATRAELSMDIDQEADTHQIIDTSSEVIDSESS